MITYMENESPKHNPIPEGFVPNKALGQNFLSNESVIQAILDAAQIDGKRVLEIGPGTGALTDGLISRAAFLAAVEKDGRLCALLEQSFGGGLSLVHADFLDADIQALMGMDPWNAVGNLPYYATTPIVLRLLSLAPESMTLMVQKEAADRFFATPKSRVYGPVAVATTSLYNAKVVVNAPRSFFRPQPEVDSVVVRLTRNEVAVENPAGYVSFLKQAFSMRRKTLYNVLNKDARVTALLESLGFSADIRAEAMPPIALLRLYEMLNESF